MTLVALVALVAVVAVVAVDGFVASPVVFVPQVPVPVVVDAVVVMLHGPYIYKQRKLEIATVLICLRGENKVVHTCLAS